MASGPEKPGKRDFLRKAGTIGGLVIAAGIATVGIKTIQDAKQKLSPDAKGIKEPERIKSREEKALDIQLNFLNELKASDDIALLALCKSGSEGFEQLMRERIGLSVSSSSITDSDPKSLAGRKLIGWFNRSERQNKELGKVFDVPSLRTAVGLHIHDIEQALVRAQKKSLTNTPEN